MNWNCIHYYRYYTIVLFLFFLLQFLLQISSHSKVYLQSDGWYFVLIKRKSNHETRSMNIFEKKLVCSNILVLHFIRVQSHPQACRWQIKCNILIVPPPLFISHWEHTVREARSKWLHLIYASENISEKPFPQLSAWLSYFTAVHLYHQSWSSQSTVGKKVSVQICSKNTACKVLMRACKHVCSSASTPESTFCTTFSCCSFPKLNKKAT